MKAEEGYWEDVMEPIREQEKVGKVKESVVD